MLYFFEDSGDGFCEQSVFPELQDLSLLRSAPVFIVVSNIIIMPSIFSILTRFSIVLAILFRRSSLRA